MIAFLFMVEFIVQNENIFYFYFRVKQIKFIAFSAQMSQIPV